MKRVTRKVFEDLLAATHNIGADIEPGDATGAKVVDGALDAVDELFCLLRKGGAYADGVETVIRLYVEVSCSRKPHEYALKEAERGWKGFRHQDDGATIALPNRVPFAAKKKNGR